MKRNFAFLTILAIAMSAILATTEESSAVPAFARQTGNACNACHFQFFPKLSAMGRAFKLGGYTDASVDLIGKEEEGLSIPANLPISFVSKMRYISAKRKTDRTPKRGAERGVWEIPDEATFFIGGRLASNIGYSIEVGPEGWGKGSLLIGIPTGGDTKVGIYAQATDAHGPANGFDLMNNSIVRATRGFENRSAAYISQKMGFGTPATGLGLYAGSDIFFANVGLWGPAWGVAGLGTEPPIDTGFDLAMWARVAFTPNVAGWDLAIGAYTSTGSVKCVECGGADDAGKYSLHEIKTKLTGVDFQAQGEVGGMTLEVHGTYLTGGGKDVAFPTPEASGMDVNAFLGLTPAFGVKAGMMTYDKKDGSASDMSATNVGVWYMLAQNVQFAPEYAIYGGDGRSEDNRMLILLFMAF